MTEYTNSDSWADIVPIAQDDGGPNPLAAIAYTEEYSEAMSYLRAVMAKNEMSERALELTEHIIDMNPAHYTVWLYRAKILFTLDSDLNEELKWLDQVSLRHLKNYQIWHHRQTILSHIPTLPTTELSFLTRMLAKDVKNYHVWTYRQWLVRHFSIWDLEIPYLESLIQSDVRNNSAWNHRWYVVFGRATYDKASGYAIADEIMEREIKYSHSKILEEPQNQSPWNYLRGVLKKKGKGLRECREFAEQFADLEREDEVRSSHALDFLADAWLEEEEKERAGRALELLARRYDPIRKNYWNYRRGLMGLEEVAG